jgi:putative NADH-flavin reductase
VKIAVFGASGGTGRELVRQGRAQGHAVTAFVRKPESLTGGGGLQVVVGDARDGKAVAAAVAGQEAVLSALGARSLADDTLLPESMGHILSAMKQHDVRRLVVLGASGVWPGAAKRLSPVMRLMVEAMDATILKKAFASQRAMQLLIRASDVEWTIVQPPRLLNRPGRGKFRVDGEALPASGTQIARADVATFMLAQLGSRDWVCKSPFIAW